jgi:hypothetical protein
MVGKRSGEDTAALDVTLSAFAEPVRATETHLTYKITDASIWQARRHGLSLDDIIQTLETYSQTEIPATLLADLERWSKKIDRLTLEADQGRLFLRSANPLAITAVLRHGKLGEFVKHQVDATTLELRAETYPDVVQTFDDCKHPVLDRVKEGETPKRRRRRAVKQSARHTQDRAPQVEAPVKEVAKRSQVPSSRLEFVDMLRMHLPRQCQATTRAGQQCKNRAQPHASFCHVHADRTTDIEPPDPSARNTYPARDLLNLMVDAGIITPEQFTLMRVGIGVLVGLCTWLLYTLLMWIGRGWFDLTLASWYMVGVAFLLLCWLLGRFVLGSGLLPSLYALFITLTSLLGDFFYKDGLILNICFLIIPLVLPAAILYRYGLSIWWGLLLFPIGFVIGKLFYNLLEETSE